MHPAVGDGSTSTPTSTADLRVFAVRAGPGPESMLRHPSRLAVVALTLVVVAAGCMDSPAAPSSVEPIELAAPWETAAPREVGLNLSALQSAALRASGVERVRSVLVVRHGRLAYERYFHGARRHDLADVRSVTKSVVGALVGLAIEEGFIDGVGQPATDFLEHLDLPLRPEHDDITVGHLLTMSSGIEWEEDGSVGYTEWIGSADRLAYLLEREVAAPPGDAFAYNSAAVHLLGVVVEEATGRPLPTFADEMLFGPLGIETREWEELGDGRVNGGSGLDLRPRDLARLGQLFLQGGASGDRRILPSEWVAFTRMPAFPGLGSVAAIGPVSYGLLWWIDVERDAYFAWGYGGQLVYVFPELDMVVVTTTEWRGVSQDVGNPWLTQQAMELVIDGVLPAVR
ncbi:MAG: serine hydrolase [Longimicrobiales bacterium]|nr:serine hydrolase [Longimicrobiales bacterium]